MSRKNIEVNIETTDTNLMYLPSKKELKCPYCGEMYGENQKTYSIVKVKNGGIWSKDIVVIKKLKNACGYNCSRKVIDQLNAQRTDEEIEKEIEYKRG